ncbi:hypothetical protein [Marinobacter sp.]|uniref:hypothetical protein n=1 Tax=Marinobacter sp. TaxID=50741 RepID=UPI0035642F12
MWSRDLLFFFLVFLGLSVTILAVNLLTTSYEGVSGHALATVLAGLALVRYRWDGSVPGYTVIVGFSVVAGFSAILYLYLFQILASLIPRLEFDPLRGYEIAFSFFVNALVFWGTMWFRRRATAR